MNVCIYSVPPRDQRVLGVPCVKLIWKPKSGLGRGRGHARRNKMVAVNMISCGSYTAASKENGLEVLGRRENGLRWLGLVFERWRESEGRRKTRDEGWKWDGRKGEGNKKKNKKNERQTPQWLSV